jgi:hypothetical protein
MTLKSVPDPEPLDAYGHIEVYTGLGVTGMVKLKIGVSYGDPMDDLSYDILLDQNGQVIRHPLEVTPRMSTEEERAAVGWTW